MTGSVVPHHHAAGFSFGRSSWDKMMPEQQTATTESLGKEKLQRLRSSIERSRRKLSYYRQQRYEVIAEYLGPYYSEEVSADRRPLNLLSMAINIYKRLLSSRSPKATVGTLHEQLKTSAHDMQLALNHLFGEIKFGGLHSRHDR